MSINKRHIRDSLPGRFQTKCLDCMTRKSYNEYFDCFFCDLCDKWLEKKCCDSPNKCWFNCHTRPEKPSQCKRGQR